MNHFMLPARPSHIDISIPYLSKLHYDGKGYQTYPVHRAYTFDRQGLIEHEDHSEELLSFYQEWLYFGLMTEFFGHAVAVESFIQEVDGHRQIDTSTLPSLIRSWRLEVYHSLSTDADKMVERAKTCLLLATKHCTHLDQNHVIGQLPGPWTEIILSIKVLLGTLATHLDLEKHTQDLLLPWSRKFLTEPPSITMIKEHMIRHGWCPLRVREYFSRFSFGIIYYLASLPQNSTRKSDHGGCLALGTCCGDSIDPKTPFRCKHTMTGKCNGNCSYLPIPKAKIVDIIKSGGIPLVTAYHDSGSRLHLDIIRADMRVKYTAITHVWADGLGNTEDNAMPTCQLEDIITAVQALNKGSTKNPLQRLQRRVVFWIDTLCIPVAGGHVSLSPDDVVRLKKDAIRRMTPTYAGAERVLMFDSELTGTPGSAPVEEVLGRLLRSAWIGRCWTFQEMSLAPKLVIRMADGYFDFEQAIYHSLEIMSLKSVQGGRWTPADYISESQQALIDMTEATKPASIHRRRNRDGKTFEDPFRYKRYALKRWAIASDRASYSDMSFMPPALMGQSLQIAQFSYVWNNMNGRSTAMWEDIYSIFANLWGFRVKDIDSLSQNDRMKAMLCALGCIPIRLLFQTMTALTDESPPDRWAPSFPIGDRIDEQGRDVDYAYILGNEGILLQHAGLTTPHGGGVLCVWISSSFSRQTRFSFTLAGYGEGRWWVQLNKATGQYADPETEETNFARCLLLDHEGISKYIPAPAGCAYVSTGAMLSSVQKDGKVITGSLDSSLTFGPWIASEEENTNSEDSPPIKAELLYDIEIRIKTDIPLQYTQIFRRTAKIGWHDGVQRASYFHARIISPLGPIVIGCVLIGASHSYSMKTLEIIGICALVVGLILFSLTIAGEIWGQTCAYRMWFRSFGDDDAAVVSPGDRWFYHYARFFVPWRIGDITSYVEREIPLEERRPWCPPNKTTVQDVLVANTLWWSYLAFVLLQLNCVS